MSLIELYRIRSNKSYQMRLFSKALYYQVRYSNYYYTEKLEFLLTEEEKYSKKIMYSMLLKR